MYLIKTILDSRTKQRRTDGRYPNRIGSKVDIVNLTIEGAMEPGNMLVLDYVLGNQEGYDMIVKDILAMEGVE